MPPTGVQKKLAASALELIYHWPGEHEAFQNASLAGLGDVLL
jgi:hypothetical protein